MKNKIRKYIEYEFRNIEKTSEVLEVIEEVYLNMTEEAQNLLNEGYDEQEAYLRAVSNLGDFTSNFGKDKKEDNYYEIPKWSQILMIMTAVLAWFSIPFIVLNVWVGAISLLLSITLFLVASFYEIRKATNSILEKKDVSLHNGILKVVFKFYLKHYLAWIITLSYFLSTITARIIVSLTGLAKINVNDPIQTLNNLYSQMMIVMLISVIFFILFVVIFNKINNMIEKKYYSLTNDYETINKHTYVIRNVFKPIVSGGILIVIIFSNFLDFVKFDGLGFMDTYYFAKLLLEVNIVVDSIITTLVGFILFVTIISIIVLLIKPLRKTYSYIFIIHLILYILLIMSIIQMGYVSSVTLLPGFFVYTTAILINAIVIFVFKRKIIKTK